MNGELFEALVLASAGIASVGQILLVLLVLTAEDGVKKALAYSLGMTGVLFAVGQGALVLGSRVQESQPESSGPGAAAYVSVILGCLLLTLAVRTWRKPKPEEGTRPALFASLDSATATRLLGMGMLVGGINVKNLAIYLSAVDVVVRARLPWIQGALMVTLVTFVFCLCVLGPIALFAMGGQRGRRMLDAFRAWLEANFRAVAIGAMLVFGSAFVARGAHLFLS